MKPLYTVNMSELLGETFKKKTATFNFANAKGNRKRINSNRPRYEIGIDSNLIIAILELYYRLKNESTPWDDFFVINTPAFVGFDKEFTDKFFTFCEYLDSRLAQNSDSIKLSQSQIYTMFDILNYASVMHNKLKKSKFELVRNLPQIKLDLLFGYRMKDDLNLLNYIFAEACSIKFLKKANILY